MNRHEGFANAHMLKHEQHTKAGIARNPVDSFFVERCFVHTLGTFFIPKGLHIKAQGCPASKRDYPGWADNNRYTLP